MVLMPPSDVGASVFGAAGVGGLVVGVAGFPVAGVATLPSVAGAASGGRPASVGAPMSGGAGRAMSGGGGGGHCITDDDCACAAAAHPSTHKIKNARRTCEIFAPCGDKINRG